MDNVLKIFQKYIETETLSIIIKNISDSNINKNIEIGEIKINLKLKK
jgi:hypothetical protein